MPSSRSTIVPQAGDALIVVDVQNDFLPGGSLAVPDGQAVLAPLNRVAAVFARRKLPVFASRDWHPPDHCSFRPQGGPWPPHCLAGTRGAEFAPQLELPPTATVVSKATTVESDAYSGFQGTGLDAMLRSAGARRLFVGGLATEYCVFNTVKDGLAQGFAVLLMADAIRAVADGDGARALTEMERLGAECVDSRRIEG